MIHIPPTLAVTDVTSPVFSVAAASIISLGSALLLVA